MSSQRKPEREFTDAERQRNFIQRRYQAFGDRSRDPGDAVTWAVVLGAFICALLIVCVSVADMLDLVLLPLVVTAIWIFVVSYLGRVNIAAILWGASASDSPRVPNALFVMLPTLVVALIGLVAVIIDALTGWDFRWYGVVLAGVCLVYLGVYTRSIGIIPS